MSPQKILNFSTETDFTRLNPEGKEGDLAYVGTDSSNGKIYTYHDGAWIPFQTEGLTLKLYDLNKSVISQLPILTEDEMNEKINLINDFHNLYKNKFYMLYGQEINYFTVFNNTNSEDTFAEVVLDCLYALGQVRSIGETEYRDAIEFWVIDKNNEATCLYLFPYDSAIVEFGG